MCRDVQQLVDDSASQHITRVSNKPLVNTLQNHPLFLEGFSGFLIVDGMDRYDWRPFCSYRRSIDICSFLFLIYWPSFGSLAQLFLLAVSFFVLFAYLVPPISPLCDSSM